MRLRSLLLLLPGVLCLTTSSQAQSSRFILLVVPEADTTETSSSQYRLSASTNRGSSVDINDIPYRVYPSGAFAGLLELSVGDNPFTVRSVSSGGDTLTKTFLVRRIPPPRSTPRDTLRIDDVRLEPAGDLWLGEGDILQVQLKGTPGCVATFLDGKPMRELAPGEANGIEGIYRGVYKVRADDSLDARPVTFALTDSTDSVVTSSSRATVAFMPRAFPMVGVTKGERPFLNVGLGEDRLGGAKFSFLNPAIRLAITGKASGQYRVALTETQEAWIPEDQVDLMPRGTFLPFSLTGTITVSGDDRYDYVTINLNDRLPYATFQELEPTRLHIDLYGAVANTNWITQLMTAQDIKDVYFTQVAKQVFRVTIELNKKQCWGYGIAYQGRNLVITLRRQPGHLRIRGLTFALDAGHGGSNRGSLGSTGALEKDVTLAIVKHLARALEDKGATVILTRSDDSYSLNSERLRAVLASPANILISVHANSIGLTSNPELIRGTSTYYKYICFRSLSVFILHEMLDLGLQNYGNVGNFNFTLNSPTELPNVLVETAFMSHPEDEMKLLDDDFRKDIAAKIVDGVEEFLDSCDD